MTNKKKYIQFTKSEKKLPIFFQPWWLDTVSGKNNWNVAIVESDNKIIAALPYHIKNKFNLIFLTNPIFTNRLGIYYKYYDNLDITNNSKKLSFEKEIFTKLINRLPKFNCFNINFNYDFKNHLPFYWKEFQQTTRYSYIIDNISNPEECYNNFDRSKKNDIKKAKSLVEIKFDLSAKKFYNHHKASLEKNGKKIIYSYNLLKKIYDICYKYNSGKIIYSIDKQNNQIHSANFVIWDNNYAYNLISTIDNKYKNSGSTSLVIYEMIKFLSDKTKSLDFEGSMIEGVEQSFRKFGTKQIQYFNISKINSKLLEFYLFLTTKRGEK